MRAGDIETEPGPRKKAQPRSHIITFLILLVLLLNKIKTAQDYLKTAEESRSKVLKSTKITPIQWLSYKINPNWNHHLNQRTVGGTMNDIAYDLQHNNISMNFEILNFKSYQDTEPKFNYICDMKASGSTMNAYDVHLQKMITKQEKEKLWNHFIYAPTSVCRCKELQENIFIIVKIRQKLIASLDMKGKKYQILLLLLGGDIKTNPGPTSHEICMNCRKEICGKEALRCESCGKWCHKDCDSSSKTKPTIFDEYTTCTWICPDPRCHPNVMLTPVDKLPKLEDQNTAPDSLEYIITPPVRTMDKKYLDQNKKIKQQHQKVNKVPKTFVKREKNLLSELPKISSKAYIGKENCSTCNKDINISQKAILCCKCQRHTHRKCSDMSLKLFKKKSAMTKPEFTWTCVKCRSSESNDYTCFKRNLCTEDQLPDDWDLVRYNKMEDEEILFHFNTRSIIGKEDDIKKVASNIKPAAIFVTESWFDDSCPKGLAVPEGYSIIRKDRSIEYKNKYGKENGGGVAILVRKGVQIKTENKLMDDYNEILWCTLKTKTEKYMIGVVYRASYTDLLKSDREGNTEMEDLLQKTINNNLVLIGDFNCDMMKPDQTPASRTLTSLAEEYKLKQLIRKPTRFCETSATIIDHIWVREESTIRKAGTCEGLSDHCGIYCYIKANISLEEEEITCRSYKSFNSESFREDVKKYVDESNFRDFMNKKDLNKAFECWLESLQKAANKHAPIITFKPKKNNANLPWYNSELQEIANTKNMHLKLYRLYHKAEDKELYKIAKNKQTHLKKKYKREYYTKKINEYIGDPRKMWSILKDVTNQNFYEDITPDIVNTDTANRFNRFFATVGVEVQKKLNTCFETPQLNSKGVFHFQPETTEKIEQLIKRIKPNVATGIDQLPAKLIKEAMPIIAEDLKDMVNLSYETNTFPDKLKVASVKALHKKGDNNDPAQYRPVSILTVISKIFERSAVDQLVTYYDQNSLLNPRQHAYRKFHSTTTSLFELTEKIKKHIDNGNLVALAALDLSKAFDSLAHSLILQKLDDMGLNKEATLWIKSYLSNRKQMVKFGKIESNTENVESGVPQGSILGPLLFITCTNDIYNKLQEYEIFTYADDMQIIIEGNNVQELGRKLGEGIREAEEYYNSNSLLCNPTKSEVMLLGSKIRLSSADKLKVEVNDGKKTKILKGEESLKLLGVHIDQSLDWTKQAKHVKQKAVNSIRNLHRINNIIPMKQKRILYTSLVTPHFSYADIIWHNCGNLNTNKIQQAQNFAAKSMLGVSKYSSSTAALKKLEMIPLAEKRNINLAVHVKKSLEGRAPENIQQIYSNQLSNVVHRAAASRQLNYPKHKLQQYQNGSLYSSIKSWNSIPVNLRNTNITTFKKKLQTHITQQYLQI